MKKHIIIGLTLILFLSLKNEVFAQKASSKPEIGKWRQSNSGYRFVKMKAFFFKTNNPRCSASTE